MNFKICGDFFVIILDIYRARVYNNIRYITFVILKEVTMPPKIKTTKETIILASLDIVRKSGADCLCARNIAKSIGCSTQPIFNQFSSMEELKNDVMAAAFELYKKRIADALSSQNPPPYKSSGLAYISFAKEERHLFRWLFMRDRTDEEYKSSFAEDNRDVIAVIQQKTGFSEEKALQFHLENWIVVHGIASMIATGYLNMDDALINKILSDAFYGLLARFKENGDTQ